MFILYYSENRFQLTLKVRFFQHRCAELVKQTSLRLLVSGLRLGILLVLGALYLSALCDRIIHPDLRTLDFSGFTLIGIIILIPLAISTFNFINALKKS